MCSFFVDFHIFPLTSFPSAVTAEEAAAKEGPRATALLVRVEIVESIVAPCSVPLLQVKRQRLQLRRLLKSTGTG